MTRTSNRQRIDVTQFIDDSLMAEASKVASLRVGGHMALGRCQVVECLRYLYLLSMFPQRFAGAFLPVEQGVDDAWHYLILQTREYRRLTEDVLPGRYFIHHRSMPYEAYSRALDREALLREALLWIPTYCESFGAFDDGALCQWTMPSFLHRHMGMTLAEISALADD